MDVVKFTLSGDTAFFKIPEVNSYFYFTYGCIHKITLLGIFGAICGYGGYNQQNDSGEVFPEFYSKLKDIKIGIVPKNKKGYISKKIQIFNNSVGYASKEKGGNLIVKEQWLEEPEWEIYIQIDEKTKELTDRLINKNFEYIPYLGKNDHLANITNVELIKDIKAESEKKIDSIFSNKNIELVSNDSMFNFDEDVEIFKYQEMLPTSLETVTNNYELKTFIFTNSKLNIYNENEVYNCNGEYIFFF